MKDRNKRSLPRAEMEANGALIFQAHFPEIRTEADLEAAPPERQAQVAEFLETAHGYLEAQDAMDRKPDVKHAAALLRASRRQLTP